MASPTAVGGAGIGLSAGGSLLSAYGAEQKGQAQSQMYTYQAGIASLNSQIATGNRDYAIYSGGQDAARYGMKSAQAAGSIKAKQGASGIDVNSGSSVNVQQGQKQISDLDQATIRNNAARTAYGYEEEATIDTAQGQMYTSAASNSLEAGNIAAAGSLISGAASVSDKWLAGNKTGLWGS